MLKIRGTFSNLICMAVMCLAFTTVVGSFAGCTKDLSIEKEEPGPVDPDPDDNDGTFDYNTKHDVTIRLSYQVPEGYRPEVYIYAQNPISINENNDFVRDTTMQWEIKGRLDRNGEATFQWNKADVIKEIYVYSPSSMVPRLVRAAAEGDEIHVTDAAANVVIRSREVVTRGSTTGAYYKNWPVQNIRYKAFGQWDENGMPDYLLNEKKDIPASVGRIIDATLPLEGDMNPNGYLREAIHLSEESHVKAYFYAHTSARKNVIAYYTYSGDTKNIPSQNYINSNLIVLYPNMYQTASQGQGVQLQYFDGEKFVDTFPAGVNIGWVLLPNAFQSGSIETKNVNVIYSAKKYNRYDMTNVIMADRPHVGMFMADNHYVLAFEDQPWGNAYDKNGHITQSHPANMRDDVLLIEADPVKAMPDDVPDGNDPVDPNDPALDGWEFHYSGILAFEDLWPNKGDYDMNDVVVKYELTDYFSLEEAAYTGFQGTFTYLHNGAQRNNGFGLLLSTTKNNIRLARITSDYTCNGQGLDENAQKAMIMIFDNGKTVPENTTFEVKVVYDKPVLSLGYKIAPYNPFIIINNSGLTQGNRTECHLVNFPPTEKVNTSNFGTHDDLSQPDRGIYYVSDSKYPFAIDLAKAENFIGSREKVAIDEEYPLFDSWVRSNGKENQDWYLHPNN